MALISGARAARPSRPLVAEGRTLTYAELNERATGLARRLAVSPGDRVPAALPPGLAFCELLHALPRRGAAWSPLDPRGPAAPALPLGPPSDVELLDTVDPEAVHTVIQTSGTTGEPKAVELTYANHEASARRVRRRARRRSRRPLALPCCRCTTWPG